MMPTYVQKLKERLEEEAQAKVAAEERRQAEAVERFVANAASVRQALVAVLPGLEREDIRISRIRDLVDPVAVRFPFTDDRWVDAQAEKREDGSVLLRKNSTAAWLPIGDESSAEYVLRTLELLAS